jgi:hypothetical protein
MERTKKELKRQYKARKVTGGVYAIRNTATDKLYLEATTDLRGSQNRFEFAKKTGSCIEWKLQRDWAAQGGDGFVFEVLETLEKGETQTDSEFQEDILLLKGMWLERLAGRNFY